VGDAISPENEPFHESFLETLRNFMASAAKQLAYTACVSM